MYLVESELDTVNIQYIQPFIVVRLPNHLWAKGSIQQNFTASVCQIKCLKAFESFASLLFLNGREVRRFLPQQPASCLI